MGAAVWLMRWSLVITLLLLFATWRLWIPQSLFPRVPLLEIAASWPSSLNWAALAVVAAGLSAITWLLALKVDSRVNVAGLRLLQVLSVTGTLGGISVLVILDQHRLQPWVVHWSLLLALWTLAEPAQFLRCCRALTVSIYAYSAISKFDAQFLHTVGQDFLVPILNALSIEAAEIPIAQRLCLAALFPLGELIIAVALIPQATRGFAACAAIGMHLTLILLLGPLGLQHEAGVLLWNTMFIGQVVCLFLMQPDARDDSASIIVDWLRSRLRIAPQSMIANQNPVPTRIASSKAGVLAECLMVVALIVPAGERLGIVDHWLGWALYAPHSSRVNIEVAADAVDRLPKAWWLYVAEDRVAFDTAQGSLELTPDVSAINAPESDEPEFENASHSKDALPSRRWVRVRLGAWSLGVLHAPLYPQQRFQVGVARAIAQELDEEDIRVELLSAASHWSGERVREVVAGRAELERAAQRYWFNTRPASDY